MKNNKFAFLCTLTFCLSTINAQNTTPQYEYNFIYDKINKLIDGEERVNLTEDEVAELALNEINNLTSQNDFYSIKSYKKISDLDNNNYLFVNFNPYGNSVISLENYTTIEIKPFSTDEIEYSNSYYLPVTGEILNENGVFKIKNSLEIVDEEILIKSSKSLKENIHSKSALNESLTLKKNLFKKTGGGGAGHNDDRNIDIDKKEVTADIEIPYSWFFKYNKTQFAYYGAGSNGICEYIAYLLLAEYNDFFKAKGYFSDEEVSKYISTNNSGDYRTAIPTINDKFAYDLYIKNKKKETLNAGDLNSLSNMFLKNKNVSYENVHAYWLFGNPVNVLESGRPDMLCGYFPDGQGNDVGHNIVAYGYFNSGTYAGKYLTHYGWNWDTQCIVDRKVFNSGYDWSLKDTTKNPTDRYIFEINGELRCGKDLPK